MSLHTPHELHIPPLCLLGIVLVPRKDGSLRFCVDYRQLNAKMVPDAYPLPRIDDCLDSLVEAEIFTTLDCSAGFWQVLVAPEDRDKDTFTSYLRTFRYTRMPLGDPDSDSPTNDELEAFENLKRKLVAPPILGLLKANRPNMIGKHHRRIRILPYDDETGAHVRTNNRRTKQMANTTKDGCSTSSNGAVRRKT